MPALQVRPSHPLVLVTCPPAKHAVDQLQGIAITFALIAIILTLTHLTLTHRSSHRFHLDSFFSATATFLVIPYTIGSLIDDQVQHELTTYSMGWMSSLPSMKRIQIAFKTEVACTALLWLIICFSKATFLAVYWRALCEKGIAKNVWFAMTSLTALFFAIIFLSVFWVCGSPQRVGDLGKSLACRGRGCDIELTCCRSMSKYEPCRSDTTFHDMMYVESSGFCIA